MKSHLMFLAATIAAGSCLVFSAANAQELPTVLHTVWLQSTKVRYDPLLVATFLSLFVVPVFYVVMKQFFASAPPQGGTGDPGPGGEDPSTPALPAS